MEAQSPILVQNPVVDPAQISIMTVPRGPVSSNKELCGSTAAKGQSWLSRCGRVNTKLDCISYTSFQRHAPCATSIIAFQHGSVGPSSAALVIRLGHIPKHYTSDCNIPFSVSRESPTNTVRPSRCNLIIFRAHAKNDLDFDPVFVLPDCHYW